MKENKSKKMNKKRILKNKYGSFLSQASIFGFMDSDFIFDKIYGSWLGKIAGGTYAMPMEGHPKQKIQNRNPPLTGWTPAHRQVVNDDEQYEFIALMALENTTDEQLKERWNTHTLLSPEHQGPLWEQNLHPLLVFTAEKAALINATKANVPWEHAGDEIFNGCYQNPYFDWIGAQMKGELFGMLSPAWGWHQKGNSVKQDLEKLYRTLSLSYQDARLAHRGVGIVGELFVSCMISVALDFNIKDPQQYTINYPAPCVRWLEKTFMPSLELPKEKSENIIQIGLCAELLKEDIRRVHRVLEAFSKNSKQQLDFSSADVETYFRFITPVLEDHDKNPDPRRWEEIWEKVMKEWTHYFEDLERDAKIRLSNDKKGLKARLKVLRRNRWVHTLGNNTAIVIGLIYGDGDFTETILKATECGMDTDCNAGNAGAILGAYLGARMIPVYFKRFIRGEMIPALKTFNELSIQRLAERTINQMCRIEKLNPNFD